MFFDDLRNKLNAWVRQKHESIFVIDGPSQIGKTFFINDFLKHAMPINLYIDVKKHKDLLERLLSDSYNTADDFYTSLCFEFSKTPSKSLILLVFDGLEYCPRLRQFFKTLVKHPYINILGITCGGTGPLHYKDLLVPSEEEIYHMHPLTFYEYMVATNQKTLAEHLKESLKNKAPVGEYLSSKIYKLYKTYNLVGGYPETVYHQIERNDLDDAMKTNKYILDKQFEHAMSLLNDGDSKMLGILKDNFADFIKSGKYNFFKEITPYKMKQLLMFLEEEGVINIASAFDISNQNNQTNAKKVFFSHQCFYYALSYFKRTDYFDNNNIGNDIVLTDFYFNQKVNGKPLNYALYKSTRYFESDALIVNNTNMYVVELKEKRMDIDYNISLARKSNGLLQPGVLLLNANVFKYGDVCVLPSYCSCFLNRLFIR